MKKPNPKWLTSKYHVRTTRLEHLGGGKTLVHLGVKSAILGVGTLALRKIEAPHIEFQRGVADE